MGPFTSATSVAVLAAAANISLNVSPVAAAVHPYADDYFYSVGDAFIFRGGREGLFESKSEVRVLLASCFRGLGLKRLGFSDMMVEFIRL